MPKILDPQRQFRSRMSAGRAHGRELATPHIGAIHPPDYALKLPPVYDLYEGEWPVAYGAMNPAPALFVFRGTVQFIDGSRREDYQARQYAADCKQRGWKYAPYHFMGINHVTEQAWLYSSLFDALRSDYLLPCPIMDIERDPGSMRGKDWSYQCETFKNHVLANTGAQKMMVYSSQHFFSFLCDREGNPPDWILGDDILLWPAYWPDHPDDFEWLTKGMLPAGWAMDKCVLWQYKDNGRDNGYPANDLSIPSAEFAAELGAPPEPPIDPPIGETMKAHNPSSLWLHTSPDALEATRIKLMSANTAIEGNEIVTASDGSKWLHATLPQVGYCASWLLVYDTAPDPEPTTHTIKVTVCDNGTTIHEWETQL